MKTCNKSKCNKSTRTETETKVNKTRQVGLKTQTKARAGFLSGGAGGYSRRLSRLSISLILKLGEGFTLGARCYHHNSLFILRLTKGILIGLGMPLDTSTDEDWQS